MPQNLLAESIQRLQELFDQALVRGEPESNSAVLATADLASGRPSVRNVYIHLDTESLVFFVDERSGKGQQLAWNPQAAVCFFWRQLAQQVVIDGDVSQLDDTFADRFWRQRLRASTLGARASRPHAHQADKQALDKRVRREKERYDFAPVERPESWIGYRLYPDRLAFWDTGWHRMRLRHSVERQLDGSWRALDQEP